MKIYTIAVQRFLASCGDDTVRQYDMMKLVVAVQGLQNRNAPSLFLFWQDADRFWMDFMREDGNFLQDAVLEEIPDFASFLTLYGDFIHACGIVAWDETVPATMNAATTACGVTSMLPIRYSERPESVLQQVCRSCGAEIRLNLSGRFTGSGTIWQTSRPSSGSAKCDAYLWALENYFDRCSDSLLFYTLDAVSWDEHTLRYPDLGNAFVYNHDYAISKRAFVFDLCCYDDETPCDDPMQPLGCDLRTMKEILLRQVQKNHGEKMTTVCGFNPWQLKYTTHGGKGSHEPVAAEWRLTEILSAYNCVKDADAFGYCGLANASLYTHYPLREHYSNRPAPDTLPDFDPQKTYILFYVGDYDAAAWLTRHVPMWFKDPALGKNPLMWCFNPNLSDRVPMVFDFVYRRFTDNDFFAAGDSGAGYNNLRLLYPPRIHSALPDASALNIAHNRPYFERFDLHDIGFVINGVYPLDDRQMEDLTRFADGGIGYNNGPAEASVRNDVVFMPHSYDVSCENATLESCVRQVLAGVDRFPREKRFHIFRTILTSPTQHDEILEAIRKARPETNFTLLDPRTFFALAKKAVEKGWTL